MASELVLVPHVERLVVKCFDSDWRSIQSVNEYTDFSVIYTYDKVLSLQKLCNVRVFKLLKHLVKVKSCTLDQLLSELVKTQEIPSTLAQKLRSFVLPERIRYFKPTALNLADVTIRVPICAFRPHEVNRVGPVRDLCVIPIQGNVENYGITFASEHADRWYHIYHNAIQVFYRDRPKSTQEVTLYTRFFLDENQQVVKMLDENEVEA